MDPDVKWRIIERIKSTLRDSTRPAARSGRDPEASGNGLSEGLDAFVELGLYF